MVIDVVGIERLLSRPHYNIIIVFVVTAIYSNYKRVLGRYIDEIEALLNSDNNNIITA